MSTEKKAFRNERVLKSKWNTGPEAEQAYTYIPEDSELPALYAQENAGDKAMVHVKLFDPTSGWTWYLLEANRESGEAFGFVVGFENELGYVDLNELAQAKRGLPIERDIHFRPTLLREVMEKHERDR